MSQLKGLFKRFTGDGTTHDALAKQSIIDAENKLNIFKETTNMSITGLEGYLKYMSKTIDSQLAEKFGECKETFKKFESKGDFLNPNSTHLLGVVFARLNEIQQEMQNEVNDFVQNIELNVLKPLNDYQREVSIVKENRKDLSSSYEKILELMKNLEKAKRETENIQRTVNQTSRLTVAGSNDIHRNARELVRLEEKVQRIEKELDEANAIANEKYDKYTESLYKRVSDECELSSYYLEYLNFQKRYHKQAIKRLDSIIPNVQESLMNYSKKPVFGCSILECVNNTNSIRSLNNIGTNGMANNSDLQLVSPVIRRIIESMCKQNVFNEEGIFRVTGSRIKMNCLMNAINAGYLDYLDLTNDFDVHCLAGVLKQYIRELPDSILCNDMTDQWLNAINTSPLPNKLEAFKKVLQSLPRTNYENLKYLIKFLVKIVENSEKTKMTSTNMGICFGVSLLSNTNAAHINSSFSKTTAESLKSIDMSTATNVFDFILTNHAELLPGDINFLNSPNSKLNSSAIQFRRQDFNNVSIVQQSPYKDDDYLQTSLKSSFNNQSFNNNNNTNKSFNRTDIALNESQNESLSASTLSLNKIASSNDSSPKLKGKKQAPAPPPPVPPKKDLASQNNEPNLLQQRANLSNHSSSSNSLNTSTSELSNPAPTYSKPGSIYPTNLISVETSRAPNELNVSPMPNNNLPSQKLKTLDLTLEKPNQPPPQVPNRPVIGFNINNLFSDEANNLNDTSMNSPPYPTSTTIKVNGTSNEVFMSNPSLSMPSVCAESGNSHSPSQLQRPPKPCVPRKPSSMIAAHLNKFESKQNADQQVSENEDEKSNHSHKLSSSEITSL